MSFYFPTQSSDSLLVVIVQLLIGFGIVFIFTWAVRKFLKQTEKRLAEKTPGFKTGFKFLERLIVYSVIILGVAIVVFAVFPGVGNAVYGLFVAAGFGAIVLGLAAQSTLSNIFAGMSIATSQPFKINDAVRFRDVYCTVEDIRLTHTVLRSWDNRRFIVPNSVMQAEVFINYTLTDPSKLVPVTITISHESDLELAKEIMLKAAREHPDSIPMENGPNVVVMDVNSTGVQLRLLTNARNQDKNFDMTRDLLKSIKAEFDKNGIVIPYPRTHLILDKDSVRELKELLQIKDSNNAGK